MIALFAIIGVIVAASIVVANNRDWGPPVVVCPHCGCKTRAYVAGRGSAPLERQQCSACRRRFELGDPPDEADLPRIAAPPGPQIAGMTCAVCGDKIHLFTEGAPCATCQAPVHLDCLPHPHGGGERGPYRD